MNYFITDNNCKIVKSKLLSRFPELIQGCSTRYGGVSSGIYESMNLNTATGDSPENVLENFKILCREYGIEADNVITAKQTHTNRVRKVTEQDCGKGVIKECDYNDIDALVYQQLPGSNVPVTLSIGTADCVPVFIYDPVHRAIGAAHSGWKGTVTEITKETILAMSREFGSKAEDLYLSTGPCICKDCYEVSEEVALEFAKVYNDCELEGIIFPGKQQGKYQLDLTAAIKTTALNCGVKPENIEIQGLCTCCNPTLLFSHRFTQGKRGGMANFLGIRV